MIVSVNHVVLFILLCQHLCEVTGGPRIRRYIPKGTIGSKLIFKPGDNVVSFIIPNKHFVSRPYLYYFALSDTELLSFKPSRSKLFRSVWPRVIKPKEKLAQTKLLNRKKKLVEYVGAVGQLVGRMMVGANLYFNLFFCNDKHYVHYLTYGAYSDKWFEDHVFRVSKKCPVRAPLTKEMRRIILRTKTFTLLDAYNRPTTLTIKEWADPRWSHPWRVRFNLVPEVREYVPDPRDYGKPVPAVEYPPRRFTGQDPRFDQPDTPDKNRGEKGVVVIKSPEVRFDKLDRSDSPDKNRREKVVVSLKSQTVRFDKSDRPDSPEKNRREKVVSFKPPEEVSSVHS